MDFLKKTFKSEDFKSGIVFIVEDNPFYGRALQGYIEECFPEIKEVKIFPVGETCLLELGRNPDVIIMDYFLDTKHSNAGTGLDMIKKIRTQKPKMNIILLSAKEETAFLLEAAKKYNCSYIRKDESAFLKVQEVLKEFGLAAHG